MDSHTDLPCDSEPRGEDAGAGGMLTMAEIMAVSLTAYEPALGRVLRDADGHPWSPGEGTRAIAEAERDVADAAFRGALREFCAALGLPVPADWRRAQRAFSAFGLNGNAWR